MTSKTKTSSKILSKLSGTSPEASSDPDYKAHLTTSLELSRSLIAEIDNLMGSNLPPAQVGKVLGDIISGFGKQLDPLEEHL